MQETHLSWEALLQQKIDQLHQQVSEGKARLKEKEEELKKLQFAWDFAHGNKIVPVQQESNNWKQNILQLFYSHNRPLTTSEIVNGVVISEDDIERAKAVQVVSSTLNRLKRNGVIQKVESNSREAKYKVISYGPRERLLV